MHDLHTLETAITTVFAGLSHRSVASGVPRFKLWTRFCWFVGSFFEGVPQISSFTEATVTAFVG